jgi:hypothetical protein
MGAFLTALTNKKYRKMPQAPGNDLQIDLPREGMTCESSCFAPMGGGWCFRGACFVPMGRWIVIQRRAIYGSCGAPNSEDADFLLGYNQSEMPTVFQTLSADPSHVWLASPRSIHSLPDEVLIDIACHAITEDKTNPFRLSTVCRRWRATFNSDPRLWTTLVLRSWSGRDMVSVWLGRSKNEPLSVMIDAGEVPHRSSETPFEGLQLAFRDITRWKELIIISFPTDEALNSWNVTLCSPVKPPGQLEVLEIFPGCGQSVVIMKFLDSLTASPLKRVHMFSSSVVTRLVRHRYRSIFNNLADLHIDGRQLNEPVDILPLLSRLQSLTAYYLPLPEYNAFIRLPLVWGLRRLHLEGVSVQWMGGRTFHNLQHCSILAPRKLARLANNKVPLPVCQEMIFDGHPFTSIHYFHAPNLNRLILRTIRRDQDFAKTYFTRLQEKGRDSWLAPLDIQCNMLSSSSPIGPLGPSVLFNNHIDFLPNEILGEILSFTIQDDRRDMYNILGVCKLWRDLVDDDAHLWSTFRIRKWTKEEQVKAWLRRSRGLLKVELDTETDSHSSISGWRAPYTGLQEVIRCASSWQELFILSFTSDISSETLLFAPDNGANLPNLKSVEVSSHCQESAKLNFLLDWILTRRKLELHKLKLHSPFASKSFLEKDLSYIHYCLTTFIVDGQQLDKPVDILPHFERLEFLHARHLPLPDYKATTDLLLVQTLCHLHLEATSIQWIGGREFGRLKHCVITLPRRHQTIELVRFPVCKELAFDGYPLRTLGLIQVSSVEKMVIRSHDADRGRLNAFLAQIQTRGEMFSMLRSFHLGVRCSQRAMVNAFHCINGLEELTLAFQRPSNFGRALFRALRAERSPLVDSIAVQDCWCVDVLPSLTSLRLHYMRGHRSDLDYETIPLVRAVAWSRKQAASSLRELKVWAGNRNAVDYASASYFREHLRMKKCCDNLDKLVVTSTLTQELTIYGDSWCCLTKLLESKHGSLAIFGRLKILDVRGDWSSSITLSDLKQLRHVKILRVTRVVLAPVLPDTSLPLFSTLREIYMEDAPTRWMSSHVFMNLATLSVVIPKSGLRHQEFHFNAGQGRNNFPCLCTIHLLQTRRDMIFSPSNWCRKKLDQLVHMIWGAAEVRKTEYEEDDFRVFCAEALQS